MDLRGHGLSEKPRDAYGDPATWAADTHGERAVGGIVLVGAISRLGEPVMPFLGEDVLHDDLLERLTIPVLITHGLDDEIVLPAIAEHHARLIPHAKTSWYEGIGHTPFREEPDRFNAELRAFASSL
jgi:pimeloyl-ACP methyl ester carboxylesterase